MTTAAAVDARGISGSEKALTYAISAIARSGATRSGYIGGWNGYISIGGIATGADKSMRVLVASLSIRDSLNEQPNTCTFTVQGARPVDGAEILITLGTSAPSSPRLFAGNVIRLTEVYVAQNPRNILWQVEGIDYTWRLNAKRVNQRYRSQNAAAILADLMTRYAPAGFTAVAIGALPDVDEISMTDTPLMDAIAQLAVRIGGYAVCGYDKVVRLFLDDPATPPQPLTPAHPSLESVSVSRDLSQIVTRAIVVGGGVNALAEVAPGGDRIPVDDAAWYSAGGGYFASGPQRGIYGGVVPGGPGAMIGTGAVAVPTTAPVASIAAGAGLPTGTYQYAYTWTTAAGETTPSPAAVAPLAPSGNPTAYGVFEVNYDDPGGSLNVGVYHVAYLYAQDDAYPPTRYTKWSPEADIYIYAPPTGNTNYFHMAAKSSNDPKVKWIYVVRTASYNTPYYLDGHKWANNPTLPNNSTLAELRIDGPADAALISNPTSYPVWTANNVNRTGTGAITLTGINPGPSGTTGRKVYRTAVNAAQLKLHTTIANNSATSIAVDATADASLGANAPVSNTAGLVVTTGVVLAGSTVIPVSSVGPFGSAGWAIVAPGQLIRYTGVSATELTGVPSTGPGSLEATVAHGELITVAPQLIGIPAAAAGGVAVTIQAGDPVNLLVVVDDPAAIAWLAAARGGDGIAEGVLTDNRISYAEAYARAESLLAQNAKPIEALRYRCRDLATRSGAEITVNLPPPFGVVATFRIQDVTIGGFLGTGHAPTFDASASSQRFSFEDLLRRQRVKAQP